MLRIFFKIVINTIILSSGKIISLGLSIFSILLLTRYLNAEGYGTFTLAFNYVSFFSAIADFGLQTTMVRELSLNPNDKKQYGNFLLLKVALIMISSLLAVGALLFFPYTWQIKSVILVAIAAVSLSGITTYTSIIFQSRLRLDLVTVIDLITKVVTTGFIILFVALHYNIYFIVGSVLLGNLVGLIIGFALLQDVVHFAYDPVVFKKIISASFSIGITSFLGLAYFKIDTIMLSVMKNASEVGFYSLSYKVLENLLILWGFYMASVYPLLSQLRGKGEIFKIKLLLRNSVLVALGGSLIIIIVGYFLAPIVIQIFGGQKFYDSIPALRILLFALPFLFVNNLFSDFLFSQGKTGLVFTGILLSLVGNIILNLYFIPIYGFIGASYITVVSAAIFSIYSIMLLVIFRMRLLRA